MPNPGRPATGKANVTIRLSPDQWRAVKLAAEQRKCSYSAVIEDALQTHSCAKCGTLAPMPVFGLEDCAACRRGTAPGMCECGRIPHECIAYDGGEQHGDR
jgi:hypothetical protein